MPIRVRGLLPAQRRDLQDAELMIGSYRTVLGLPGAAAFSAAGVLARLPMAMTTLVTVLLVHGATGSYALAGAVTATAGVAGTIVAPWLARRVDRRGQAAVLRPTVLVHAASLIALVALVTVAAPGWTYFVAAGLAGMAFPPAGTLVRARWACLLRGTSLLHTAHAWETALDEMLFMVGPLVVAGIAMFAGPAPALLLAAATTVTGGLWLAAQASTAPVVASPSTAQSRTRLPAGVFVVAVVLATVGALCGSISILTAANARELGHLDVAGPALGLWAVGSLVAVLVYGGLSLGGRVSTRFVLAVGLFVLTSAPLAFVDSLVGLLAAMTLAGAGVSPVFIAANGLVEELVPERLRTQGLVWSRSGMALAGAGASVLAGVLTDRVGASVATTAVLSSAPIALLVSLVGYRCLNRRHGSELPMVPAPRADIALVAG